MKFRLLTLLFFLPVISQAQEFERYENDLIYSPETMRQLSAIVDSLNLRFKTCEALTANYSWRQAHGHHINVDSIAEEALQFMMTNPSFQAFIQKFACAKIDENILIVRQGIQDEEGKSAFKYLGFPGRNSITVPYTERHIRSGNVGNWIFEYYDMTQYKQPSALYAFFLETPPESRLLPERYTHMVQYVDCMVDTNTQVFFANATYGKTLNFAGREDNPPAVDSFYQYIDLQDNPIKDRVTKGQHTTYRDIMPYQQQREERIRTQLASTTQFRHLLEAAAEAAASNGNSDPDLERWAGEYLSPVIQLKLMRSRKVYGQCSQDHAPRDHALAIAKLAAETASWDIFLRAHLDILNDRFARNSDASYGRDTRGTYIRELEQLGFDVPLLLMGITLRVYNPAKNHYYGSTDRIGRALSESREWDAVSEKIRLAIADTELDDFNRLLFWYLYQNMAHWRAREACTGEKPEDVYEEVERQLTGVRQTLPTYIAKKLESK